MWSHLVILLAVGSLGTDSKGLSEPLVSFGMLSEVELNGDRLRYRVDSIAADLLNPGGLIIGNFHSVGQIFSNRTLTTLAGNPSESSSKLGVGTKARFSVVTKTVQFNNGEDIIVADYGYNCILKVNRQTALVSRFAGRCGDLGVLNGSVDALEARLPKIIGLEYVKSTKTFYYLSDSSSQIAEHDLDTNLLTLKYSQPGTLENTWGMVADSSGKYLYVTHRGGISKISTTSWTITLVAGQNAFNPQNRLVDGKLLEARFIDYISRLTWLIPDQVLLAGEPGSRSLRVINLFDGVVSTLCRGVESDDPRIRFGGQGTCRVYFPRGVEATGGEIYIGDSSGSGDAELGHILKLTYHQPICVAIPVEHGRFEPVQERYTHNQTIRYRCDNGYGVSSNDSRLTCVRAVHQNGTVYGKWDKLAPTCQNFTINNIYPDTGQSTGGTSVTISGTLPDNLEVVLRGDGQPTTSVNLTKYNSRLFGFKMPPKSPGGSDNVTMEVVLISDGNRSEVYPRVFTYLPAPVVTEISRNGSIARGELVVDFKVTNMASGRRYALRISGDFPRLNNTVTVSSCDPMTDFVRCWTPNVAALFYNNSFGNISHYVTVKADLLSEGIPTAGATNFDFVFSSTFPELESSNNELPYTYNLTKDDTINLPGKNLDILLTATDYQVLLMFDQKEPLTCLVTNLNKTSLQCAPPEDRLREYRSSSYLQLAGSIQVSVGPFIESVRSIEFVGWEKTTANGAQPILPREENLTAYIGVAVAVSILCIVGLVIFITVRRRRTSRTIEDTDENSEGYEQNQPYKHDDFEDRIDENLMSMIAKLSIEPTHVTFDFKAQPIGKGHFGNVYLGQMHTKNNILRTVAVKTFKATADIGVEDVEQFLNEAVFMLYHDHPNILKTIGVVWRKGDRPQVVLPYMAHGDLGSLLRKPDIVCTNGDVLHFGIQIACGLEYLTANRCLHRDIAARNCLVNEDFLVKIADFGMSKDVYTDNYYKENHKGKPKPVKWMAIECLREGKYNSQTEVWSFGVLLWELLTRGSMPYPEVNNDEIYDYLMTGRRLRKPAFTHPVIFSEIFKCWDENPENRPTFTEMRETLESFLAATGNDGQIQQQSDIETAEEFKHSYKRNQTKKIPDDYINSGYYNDHMEYLPTTDSSRYGQYCLSGISCVEVDEDQTRQGAVLPKGYLYVNTDGGHVKASEPGGGKEGYVFL